MCFAQSPPVGALSTFGARTKQRVSGGGCGGGGGGCNGGGRCSSSGSGSSSSSNSGNNSSSGGDGHSYSDLIYADDTDDII